MTGKIWPCDCNLWIPHVPKFMLSPWLPTETATHQDPMTIPGKEVEPPPHKACWNSLEYWRQNGSNQHSIFRCSHFDPSRMFDSMWYHTVSAAKIRLKREVDSNTKKASARGSRPRQKKCHSGLSFKPVSYCCLHVIHHTCHYHYSRNYHVDNLAPWRNGTACWMDAGLGLTSGSLSIVCLPTVHH